MSRLAVLVVVLAVAACLAAPQAHGRDLSTPYAVPTELIRHNDTTVVAPSNWRVCNVKLEVKTGDYWRSGTDSSIGFNLTDESTDESHKFDVGASKYFETGNLDEFDFSGYTCKFRPCILEIGTDGSGASPDWFCVYVQVTTTWMQITEYQMRFTVNKWIGPNTGRWSVFINNCANHASMAVAS